MINLLQTSKVKNLKIWAGESLKERFTAELNIHKKSLSDRAK